MESRDLPKPPEQFLPHLEVLAVAFSLREERLRVLLCSAPGVEAFALPGSGVHPGKALEEAASHSIYHLTGLRETYLEQLYTYGDTGRSTAGALISVVYFALLPAQSPTPPSHTDAVQAKWFPVDDLPEFSGDHAEILAYALRRLRYKLEYSAVGFQLLPEAFSLTELQQTYEIILGETLDKRNFRRRILEAGIIEPTPTLRGGGGRPARLYRYRPDAVAEVKTRRLFP